MVTLLAGLVVVWYVFAVILNAPFQRDLDRRAGETPGTIEFLGKTLSQPKPTLPAPHQVAVAFFDATFLVKPWSVRSLVYHAWVTLSSTLLGFAFGTALGILIAVGIVHLVTLDRSLMPWIIASQTIPMLAIAPMIIVVLAAVGITGLIPKALISTYLSFFPVAVGMVKGLRSPEIINLDLMHTYNASACADLLEAARAGLGAVPVHLDEGGDRRQPGRGDRRRAADRRRGRHRRQAAVGLLLQRHHRHVGGTRRRLGRRGAAGDDRRHRRTPGRTLDGSAAGMSGLRISWQAALAIMLCIAAAAALAAC